MRVLMLSPSVLTPRLGASKVRIELAGAMRAAGVTCDLAGPMEIGETRILNLRQWERFAAAHRTYVLAHADDYDVIDFDHESLPYERTDFPGHLLMVARSVLLVHQFARIPPPSASGLRARLGRILRGRQRRRFVEARVRDATCTMRQADLVNLSNDDDKRLLVREGICPPDKVVVLPFGLTSAQRLRFEQTCVVTPPPSPVVAFVGTFDWRKGAGDFPHIVARVCEGVPAARFRLLGSKGLVPTVRQVHGHFPRVLRARIEVVSEFDPKSLPSLLADCSVGVFPSYLEGFGFGVLEMLAAAIPVIAYDAPGPPMMLGPDRLVSPGDVAGMSSKVVALLRDRDALAAARLAARAASAPFDWDRIARDTIAAYDNHLSRRVEQETPT